MTTTDIGLIGRDGELARLSRLVDPPPAAGCVQVVLGEPGVGKTVLLAEVTCRASAAGLRVLTVTGRAAAPGTIPVAGPPVTPPRAATAWCPDGRRGRQSVRRLQ